VASVLAVIGPRSQRVHVQRFSSAAEGRAKFIRLDHPSLLQFAQALESHPDCVILFGGDGTLNRYLGLLLASGIAALPVASGSGNDFARALGIPTERAAYQVFSSWLEADSHCDHPIARSPDHQISSVDIASLITHDQHGTAQQQYFSCCVNVGLDAEAAARANRLPPWMKARGGYFIGGLGAILRGQPQRYEITLDNEAFRQELWFIAALNTPTYGGGLRVAPHASITDRKLEYVACEMIPRWRLFQHIPKLLIGNNIRTVPYLNFRSVERLTVQTVAPQPVFADGEFMGFTPIEVSLAKKSLHVLRRKTL
jgi:diacylglycerol kinase (ATP)